MPKGGAAEPVNPVARELDDPSPLGFFVMSAPLLLVLLSLVSLACAQSFFYMHPMHPELHPKESYPQQRSPPKGKIRDLPSSGIIYLNRIKPIDPFVKAFGAETVQETAPRRLPTQISDELLDIAVKNPEIPSEESTTVSTTTEEPSMSTTTTTEAPPPLPKADADLSVAEIAALDDLLKELNTSPIDSKTGEFEKKKPSKLVTLRGTRVAGSAVARRKNGGRLVKLQQVGSTATMKKSMDFDPWERIGQK